MAQKVNVIEFHPAGRMRRKRLRTELGAVVDDKEQTGARLRRELMAQEQRQGIVLRLKRQRPFLGLRYNDADPISFRAGRAKKWRSDSLAVKKSELRDLSNQKSRLAMLQGADEAKTLGLWYPVSFAALMVVMVVLLLFLFTYFQANGFRIGGL